MVKCRKVRGFIVYVCGSAQLNYKIIKQYVLDEITNPLDNDRRNINVVNPYDFMRNLAVKRVKVVPRIKRYGLVFDTFQSYPYGYEKQPRGNL